MGACACPPGQGLCGSSCVDTASDSAHCGACSRGCGGSQRCARGVCTCPPGLSPCGTQCIDTSSDRSHCGACARACAAGQSCAMGACACPRGRSLCGSGCVDTATDNANCGGCSIGCPSGRVCVSGSCRVASPPNDDRAGAIALPLDVPATRVSTNTESANNSTAGPCGCTAGNDVFYTFTLITEELVYADTLDAERWDSGLFLQDATGQNLPTGASALAACSDNACGGSRSQILARLSPGRYYLVLSGCGNGAATVHFQHIRVSNGAAVAVNPSGRVVLSGALSGTGRVNAGCNGDGPENMYFWTTCSGALASLVHASTCERASFDTVLSQVSPGRTASLVCNDDACGVQSALDATIPAGAGLHALYLDTFGTRAPGPYTLDLAFGGCAAGFDRCGTPTCQYLRASASHCGACANACDGGTACTQGLCMCPAGQSVCAGGCRDLSVSAAHCGACGRACAFGNAGASCAAGQCVMGPCATGFSDCDRSLANGCETRGLCVYTSCDAVPLVAASGSYTLSTGSPPTEWTGFCDMTSDGGGWTLLLKGDGARTTFRYDSAHWTTATTLNPGSADTTTTDAKFHGFNTLRVASTRLATDAGSVVLGLPDGTRTLLGVFMGGYTSASAGRGAWLSLVSSGSLQANCNREGFNVQPSGSPPFSRVRVGIVSNQESDCDTPDSFVGFGGQFAPCTAGNPDEIVSLGNAAGCDASSGDRNTSVFGRLYGRACPPGQIPCGAACVAASFDHGFAACSAGRPTLVACASGFSSCDSDDANGCETRGGCIYPSCNAVPRALGSGVYTLSSGGSPWRAYCDQVSDGGGWTLILKADGARTTFRYDSPLWTSAATLNPLSTDMTRTEARFAGYSSLAFSTLRLVLYDGADRALLIPVASTRPSLRSMFTGASTNTLLGRAPWRGLMASGSLQANCNQEGFNVDPGNFFVASSGLQSARVRIGYVANQEADCNTPDSWVGVGGQYASCTAGHPDMIVSAGNAAGCSADAGERNTAAFAWVFVR